MDSVMTELDNKYKNHPIFQEITQYSDFYRDLSMSIFGTVTMGIKSIHNIDTYVLSSMQGTLESIRLILEQGRINDAYALLRKFHDIAIINIYANIYLADNCSIDNFVVTKINNWVHEVEKMPRYGYMSEYIKKSPTLCEICNLLYLDDHYEKIRNRCNDHTHYNIFSHLLINDNDVYLGDSRIKTLNVFSNDLRDLIIFHISCLFCINDHYMMSSDYIDYLECGEEPVEDSQYWVATFIQELLTNVIDLNRHDVYNLIKSKTSMQLA
jgi:hypothetical protein